MTEKDLSQYFKLSKEVKDLEERIITMGNGIGSMEFNSNTKAVGKKIESIQEKISELKDLWMESRVSALEKYIEIEKYIESVEDSEIRTMMRKRFLDLKDWEEIGKEFHCDRTTVSKKIRKYIKEQVSHKSHADLIK